MKKLLRVLTMILHCISLLFLSTVVEAQVVKPRQATEAQVKELDKRPALSDYADRISSSDKQKAKDQSQLLMTYAYKAVLHRSDKAKYPLGNSNKLEKRIAELVEGLPEKNYQKANERVQAALADRSKMQNDLGKYGDVVFAGKTLAEQLSTRGMQLQLSKVKKPEMKAANTAALDVLASQLYCVDETNPESGDDDMILGGIFISAGNNVNSNILFCGSFNDGDYENLNENRIGGVDYLFREGYPQVYYGMLVLVNVDEDEAVATNVLKDLFSMVAEIVEAGDQTTEYGISMIQLNLSALAGMFMPEDDFFPALVIKVELKAASDIYINDIKQVFNGNISDNWVTGNISGHGGAYRLGLKFRK
jgi:hypothetical protein